MTPRCVVVLPVSRDAESLGYILAGHTHAHEAVLGILGWRIGHGWGKLHRDGLGLPVSSHGFESSGNTARDGASLNGHADVRDGLQRGRALSVRRSVGRINGHAGVKSCQPSGLGPSQLSQHSAGADVLDNVQVHASGFEPLPRLAVDVGEELFGIGMLIGLRRRRAEKGGVAVSSGQKFCFVCVQRSSSHLSHACDRRPQTCGKDDIIGALAEKAVEVACEAGQGSSECHG